MAQMKILIKNLGQHVENYVNFFIHPDDEPKEFRRRSYNISISDYLERFATYLSLNEEDMVYISIYFDRFLTKNPTLTIYNVHLILATIIVVEQKFHEDKLYKMDCYAKVAGSSIQDLIYTEKEILKSWLSYDLVISPKEYEDYIFRLNHPPLLDLSVLARTTTLHHNFIKKSENAIIQKCTTITASTCVERQALSCVFVDVINAEIKRIFEDVELDTNQVLSFIFQHMKRKIELNLMSPTRLMDVKKNLLLFALQYKKITLATELMEQNIRPPELLYAAVKDKAPIEIIKLICDKGIDLTEANGNPVSPIPLSLAFETAQIEVFYFLLDYVAMHHINLNISMNDYVMMAEKLQLTCQYSRLNELLNNPGIRSKKEALLVAALGKRLDTLAIMILNGAVQVDFIVSKDMHFFSWVVSLGFDNIASQILNKLVIEKKIDVALKLIKTTRTCITSYSRNVLFFDSISYSCIQVALAWLEEGANPNYHNFRSYNDGTSALNLAIENGLLPVVMAMLKMPLAKEILQKAIVLLISLPGSEHASILDLILKNNPATYLELWNFKDTLHSSLLLKAIENGKPLTTIVLLCNKGLSITAKNILGKSPLGAAIAMQSTDVVRILLHNNYDPYTEKEVRILGAQIMAACDISLVIDLLYKAQRDNPLFRSGLKPIPYFTLTELSWEQFEGVFSFFKDKTILVKLIKKQVSLMPLKDEELKSLILGEALACCDYPMNEDAEAWFGSHKSQDCMLFLKRLLYEKRPNNKVKIEIEAQNFIRGENNYKHWFATPPTARKISRDKYILEHVRLFQLSTSEEKKTHTPIVNPTRFHPCPH